jgi:hypothetical protein
MTVSLYTRVSSGGKRRYVSVNKKRVYPEGTVFCLRYARKWETLTADILNTALAARAIKEASLLMDQPSATKAPRERVGIDDAITVYLSNTTATKKHRTLLAYSLATTEFRKSCRKQFLDELTKQDLTDFVVFQKKQKLADRTIDNRLPDLGTFLHANLGSGLRQYPAAAPTGAIRRMQSRVRCKKGYALPLRSCRQNDMNRTCPRATQGQSRLHLAS